MKTLIALSLLAIFSNAFAGDSLRDVKVNPLTKNEKKALAAARTLAAQIDEVILPECVNASFKYGTEPVSIQFYNYDDGEGASCTDPHYSIEVEINSRGAVSSVKLIDA